MNGDNKKTNTLPSSSAITFLHEKIEFCNELELPLFNSIKLNSLFSTLNLKFPVTLPPIFPRNEAFDPPTSLELRAPHNPLGFCSLMSITFLNFNHTKTSFGFGVGVGRNYNIKVFSKQ